MSERINRPDWLSSDDAADSALSEALAIAGEEDASAEQLERLAAGLAPLYGLQSLTSSASASSASATTSTASVSASGVSASVTASSGAGWLVGHATAAKLIAAALTVSAIGVASVVQRLPRVHSAIPVQSAPAPAANATAPAREIAQQVAPPSTAEPSPLIEPDPKATTRALHRAARTRNNVQAEAELLTDAHAALRLDAGRALQLADAHRVRYPRGALAEERELLAVQALEQLGRNADAIRRVTRARDELPRSSQVQRVAERLGVVAPPQPRQDGQTAP